MRQLLQGMAALPHIPWCGLRRGKLGSLDVILSLVLVLALSLDGAAHL